MAKSVTIRNDQFIPGNHKRPSRISFVFWISLGLSLIAAVILFAAIQIEIVPDSNTARRSVRERITMLTAQQCSEILTNEGSPMEIAIRASLAADPDINYIEIEKLDGTSIFQQGQPDEEKEPAEVYQAMILQDGSAWGYVKLHFAADPPLGLTTWATHPIARIAIFFFGASCIGSYIFLRRTVGGIEAVVPPHFRATLDSLTQGLIVMDTRGNVIVSNDAFCRIYGRSAKEIEQHPIDSLQWMPRTAPKPWHTTIQDSTTLTDFMLTLRDESGNDHILRVNSAPLIDEKKKIHGALVSFDDVTELQERNAELTEMLDQLRDSRDQIHRQNQELQVLATRDPLTFALNRRSFFEQLKNAWSSSIRYENELSCMMVDVDHFKEINDTHGHAAGDAVLRDLACLLMKGTRNTDITCRYGGEEFCIVMPHQDVHQATLSAERIRKAIESADFNGISVTCSVGVSSRTSASSPESLLDFADKALYTAKNEGRNRVVRYDPIDDCPIESRGESKIPVNDLEAQATADAAPISFQTVSALTNALAYRDAATAEHSRRVADLCVNFARDLMSMRECYILENAALLHDIGKIGVPDSILLKPGPLTADEWVVMRSNDHIGREIVKSTFHCEELVETIEQHHIPFEESAERPIPLGARILAIADSYDAMVTDRVYRKGRTPEAAFAELRRCAGNQFDPDLVEPFIQSVQNQSRAVLSDNTIVNKQIALKLGMQIESLARALDDRDVKAIADLTADILKTTASCHLDQIANLASKLNVLANDEEAEWKDCLEVTLSLIENCRRAQGVHLPS